MSNRLKSLQFGVLRIILVFLWLAVILFIIGLLGGLIGLYVMNNEIWSIFGMLMGILVVLGFLHIVISLNIISDSVSSRSERTNTEYLRINYKKILATTGIAILLILGIQSIIKFQVEKNKLGILKQQVADIGNSVITSKIVTQIDTDAQMKDLYFTRDSLLLSMDSNSITLIIPKIKDGSRAFYQITPWDYDSKDERKISEVLERPYLPNKNIKEKFDKMLKDRKSFNVKSGQKMEIFYPVEKNGELKLILAVNSGREITYQYLKERSSKTMQESSAEK